MEKSEKQGLFGGDIGPTLQVGEMLDGLLDTKGTST